MDFNEEQKKAIRWNKGPLLVLGTPGSGKTTVILNRINHLVNVCKVIPRQILVITFTRAAAVSMEQRYTELDRKSGGVRFSTFHAFFFWIVRTAYKLPVDSVLQEDLRYQWIRGILTRISPEYGNNDETIASVLQQLDRISNDMVEIDDYYSRDLPAEEFCRLYREFQEKKRKEDKIDFDDMQKMCYELLRERPDILDRIRELYPYILVDEYQDTNRIQYEILKLLAHPKDNLFAVGDDDQSIYGFRGARPEIMLGFQQEFPGAKTITLEINYRCPAVVTDTSARLIGNNVHRYSKSLRAARKTAADEWVNVVKVKDDQEENRRILQRIDEARKQGIAYSDMAILYRTNENPRRLSVLLRSKGVPYTMRDAIPNIFRHMAISPIMDYLAYANGDHGRNRFLRIMNKPVRYIRRDMLKQEQVDLDQLIRASAGQVYLQRNIQELKQDIRRLRTLPPAAGINYIRKAMEYEECILNLAEERNMDREEILGQMDELMSMAEPYQTIQEFLTFAEAYEELLKEENYKRSGRGASEEERGVQLMTMHSAKGLEFQEVHILDCVDGVIPHKKSKAPASVEEERRLFYVGMTRAIHRLYLYVPAMIGQKAVKPSPFIGEIQEKTEKKRK